MTSDLFVEWFKTQLLPALKTPHVIVMDNASFHPPYSPDLNPIEQAWTILKKKSEGFTKRNSKYWLFVNCSGLKKS